ncbi:MAG: acyl-CoA dehydratase activase-related protein [Sphaerochaetaceae bacterium]
MRLGLDVGSTTMKCVLLDDVGNLVFKQYQRHYSQIPETALSLLSQLKPYLPDGLFTFSVSGSAGMGMAQNLSMPFVQEVYATRTAILAYLPGSDVVIELGGEDAKILFLKGNLEVRMNGTCAGGTGSFIDQMASLLNVKDDQLDQLAKQAKQTYTIASRCGVFAKSDVQPLINQGAEKSDIILSVFQSVVNQTITGLAQGRPIAGNVVYLGGPLTFLPTLRRCFDETLGVTGLCPENSLYYVALGTALAPGGKNVTYEMLEKDLKEYTNKGSYVSLQPLFKDEEDRKRFLDRHAKAKLPTAPIETYQGDAFVGIDSGSTTIKGCVIDTKGNLLYSRYENNNGNPVEAVRAFLSDVQATYPNVHLQKGCSTGYGEALIKNAFDLEYSIVETIAHFISARTFMPDVDFIIDIGGQDIKCFKIRDGVVDDIFLNEACSSGCGSFLQTFSQALGYTPAQAAALALTAKRPVDLGSRCTVFMNSQVKQAQKDGASVADIFAGLAISVVKNALYKVIRSTDATTLGRHIVVQGGTFLNDAVLRAFENELQTQVVRVDQAGLMGAYGCALYAMRQHAKAPRERTMLDLQQLTTFTHSTKTVQCKGCTNHCQLTINMFDHGRKMISGNKCERIVNPAKFISNPSTLDITAFKQEYMVRFKPLAGPRGKIGLPMGLNFWENLPFWYTFFTSLGYEVVVSPQSTRSTYLLGQSTISSDTICYPAKLLHGHVLSLYNEGVSTIFYPCSSYNIDEGKGDNHFNCPVVAYYPEVLKHNIPAVQDGRINLFSPYVSLSDRAFFPKRMEEVLKQLGKFRKSEIKMASEKAYQAYDDYMTAVREQSQAIIQEARSRHMPIIVLVGRPYHNDPEVNHGIDRLMLQCGCAVISGDSLSPLVGKEKRTVLNQWTYHARMYDAARYTLDQPDMHVVQLVSFGCGLDAVTSDEIRAILKQKDRIYTQIKIDEITNLGAVRIRIRSLLAAVEEKENA